MTRNNPILAPISFDYIGQPKHQGVSMRELMARSIHGLASIINGATDPVGSQLGGTKIMIRICVSLSLFLFYSRN
jgi:hypothetical protein